MRETNDMMSQIKSRHLKNNKNNDMMSRLREKASLPRAVEDIDYAYVPESYLKEYRDRLSLNERPMKTYIYTEPVMDDETKALWNMQEYYEAVVTRELMISKENIPKPFSSYTDYRLAKFRNNDGVDLCYFYADKLVGPAIKVNKDDEEH